MTTSGHLQAICISERKGTPKQPVPDARLRDNFGIIGDAHAGPWHRQVSLLAASAVAEMKARGLPDLLPGAFAENLVIDGLDPAELGLGSRLRIGAVVELTVTQRGKVCHSHCEIYRKTGDCIMPRRGVFTRVLRGGPVAVGDPVEVLEALPLSLFQVVVLTISDKGSRGERVDTAGPAVAERLRRLPAHVYAMDLLPDDQVAIAERLRHYSDGHGIDLVAAVGGTGFSPRDVTPEAVRDVAERLTPGLDEAMRAASARITPHAVLSRASSGIRGQTLLLALPGSERAACENLDVILAALPHGLAKLRGDHADCAGERA